MPRTIKDSKPTGLPFPNKLWAMLEDPATQSIIHWTPDGLGVRLANEHRLCKEVLPQYFRTNNIASFHRQLHLYCFSKHMDGPLAGAFVCEAFTRSNPGLITHMQRFGDRKTRVRKGLTGVLDEQGVRLYGRQIVPKAHAEAAAAAPLAAAAAAAAMPAPLFVEPQSFHMDPLIHMDPLMLKPGQLSFDAKLAGEVALDDWLDEEDLQGMEGLETPKGNQAAAQLPLWGWGAEAPATCAATSAAPPATTTSEFSDWLDDLPATPPSLEMGMSSLDAFTAGLGPLQRQQSIDVDMCFD